MDSDNKFSSSRYDFLPEASGRKSLELTKIHHQKTNYSQRVIKESLIRKIWINSF